eukprot:1775587-Pleurochrysis_carterae.AAC.4
MCACRRARVLAHEPELCVVRGALFAVHRAPCACAASHTQRGSTESVCMSDLAPLRPRDRV